MQRPRHLPMITTISQAAHRPHEKSLVVLPLHALFHAPEISRLHPVIQVIHDQVVHGRAHIEQRIARDVVLYPAGKPLPEAVAFPHLCPYPGKVADIAHSRPGYGFREAAAEAVVIPQNKIAVKAKVTREPGSRRLPGAGFWGSINASKRSV